MNNKHISEDIYEPEEDSFLLLKQIKLFASRHGSCLDMGTGSGILALEASRHFKYVVATDINHDAVRYAEKKAAEKNIRNIRFIVSDLFFNVPKKKFELIIFNPPYLPEPEIKELRHKALDGGKKGHEVIEKFLKEAQNYLAKYGKILIVFSSLTGNAIKLIKLFRKHGYSCKKLDEQKLFMERLYVYELSMHTI